MWSMKSSSIEVKCLTRGRRLPCLTLYMLSCRARSDSLSAKSALGGIANGGTYMFLVRIHVTFILVQAEVLSALAPFSHADSILPSSLAAAISSCRWNINTLRLAEAYTQSCQ